MTILIKDTLTKTLAELTAAVEQFPWADRAAYADFSAQTFYYVSHSTRLLALAAAKFEVGSGDTLHWRFLAHCREEAAHEKLALKDLTRLGFSLSDFPEHHATRNFYECQYAKISNLGPHTFFGYILMLECYAAQLGPAIYRSIAAAHGEAAASFAKVHSEEDGDHVEKALAMVENLSNEQVRPIVVNLEQSAFTYASVLKACGQHQAAQKKRSA